MGSFNQDLNFLRIRVFEGTVFKITFGEVIPNGQDGGKNSTAELKISFCKYTLMQENGSYFAHLVESHGSSVWSIGVGWGNVLHGQIMKTQRYKLFKLSLLIVF